MYSYEVKREDWPWIFEKDENPALVISTLEALAVLMGLKDFFGDTPLPHRMMVQVTPTWIDNRGNGSALNKLMTTRYPASAVVMELAARLKKMALKVTVQWAPRAGNKEADALANGISDGFNPKLERVIPCEDLVWEILPEALKMGRDAENEHQAFKRRGADPGRGAKRMRRKPEERLRVTDPW